jgi:hypothetical protein
MPVALEPVQPVTPTRSAAVPEATRIPLPVIAATVAAGATQRIVGTSWKWITLGDYLQATWTMTADQPSRMNFDHRTKPFKYAHP